MYYTKSYGWVTRAEHVALIQAEHTYEGITNMMKWLVVILTAIFTGLKLASVISWSWWLVMMPAIVVFGLPVLLMVLLLLLALIAWIRDLSKMFWGGFKDGFKETINDESSKHEN